MFKVVSHDMKEEWDTIINNSKQTDIYHEWGYVNSYKINGDGEPLLFTFINDETEIINVVLKRDIHEEERLSSVKPNKLFDLISPYGYGGTLIDTENEDDINEYFFKYEKYCKKNNIISEFVRFHPIQNSIPLVESAYEIIKLGEVVALDLSSEDTVWSNIQSRMRSKIRSSLKNDVEIFFSNDISLLDRFIEIYEETMHKNNALDYYFFKREYYESLLKGLPYNLLFCYAKHEGEIISMAMMFLGNDIIHYHLSGTDQKFNKLAPNNAVILSTAIWGVRNKFKYFHLGGGLGSAVDDLLSYKKKFNKNSDFRFSIGKKIFNQEKYDELVSERNFDEQQGFFPEYRA
ncbi:GNAT family N-acetyltransferase [Macrococcoides canis]|uniref:GNAT family N-acetyltransferase n=1 Tax=Macrococcoides canis TaxID=1855823 RepID=UPI00207CBD99|nr:GNAT family N-acetyltransferase [Macrococcus canis]MCO4096708.1 GNAT family N-acetyltransferase [Macrococcus canis]UTH10032.1 GNAT family N-acetyltransferase [Macrococcus canis]